MDKEGGCMEKVDFDISEHTLAQKLNLMESNGIYLG
jgi:hypothetical protein